MDWREFTAKSVDEALINAMLELGTTAEDLEYEVIEKETSGFLGMFGKPAKIRAAKKVSIENTAKKFLDDVFGAMGINAETVVTYDKENSSIDINVNGDEMGVLIGKRGQTLDSLQYLVSLVINKNCENYVKVKLDTENYRARRKETLENLAKNIAYKVKRTRKPVSLEPMNPYERRIIHSALQNDKYVETYSEGEEPYRKVVINIKKSIRDVKYPTSPKKEYNKDYKPDYSRSNSRSGSNSSNSISNAGSNLGSSVSSNSGSNLGSNAGSSARSNSNSNSSSNFNSSTSSTSSKTFNNNYSRDYRKDYKDYKESKEKIASEEKLAAEEKA